MTSTPNHYRDEEGRLWESEDQCYRKDGGVEATKMGNGTILLSSDCEESILSDYWVEPWEVL